MKAARRVLVVTLSDFPTVGDFASVTNKSRIKKSISPHRKNPPEKLYLHDFQELSARRDASDFRS